ncbi:MAG: hypothetical protein GEV00_06875 [Actinophytocola sp.]|nr:hypothetical protein [Actinophytocola sp.]
MKTGARVAVAIGAGYVFGRTRKMRLAMMAAAASATGILANPPREVFERLMRRALSSPEINEISESVRGDLAGAAKSAAFSAATSRIEALNQRLRDTGNLPEPQAAESEPSEPEPAEPEAAEEPEPTRRRSGSGTAASRSRSTATTRRTRSGTTERAPVRRTRR